VGVFRPKVGIGNIDANPLPLPTDTGHEHLPVGSRQFRGPRFIRYWRLIPNIPATCIVFEIIGPILAKYALGKAGELGQANR
jgi:hypothetical protein